MDRDEIRRWWRAWYEGEAGKLRPLSWRQRAAYVRDYYWLWILGIVCALVLGILGIRMLIVGERDPWFHACFANTYADLGDGSDFQEGFARYAREAGQDPQDLLFDAQLWCDPTREDYGNQYYRLLIAMLDSGSLDVVVMERERLRALGAGGRLMDLEDERMAEVLDRWGDRLIWCEPLDGSYGKEQVAVGIDLSGTALAGRLYPDAALGTNALAPHPDRTALFLGYVFSEEAGT